MRLEVNLTYGKEPPASHPSQKFTGGTHGPLAEGNDVE